MLTVDRLRIKRGRHLLFDNLSFDIKSGEHLMITGPSGSGKTTLLASLAGLLPPNGGDIHYDNQNLYTLPSAQIDTYRAQFFGVLFQTYHLIPYLTVWQNIALPFAFLKNDIDEAKAMALCERLGLINKLNQKAKSLSVGEKQRCALARAFIAQPKWLFCDEPTSALDAENTQNLLSCLQDEVALTQTSLIIVTHDDRVREFFSKVHHIQVENNERKVA